MGCGVNGGVGSGVGTGNNYKKYNHFYYYCHCHCHPLHPKAFHVAMDPDYPPHYKQYDYL